MTGGGDGALPGPDDAPSGAAPLDPDLSRLALAAVEDATVAADGHIARGGWLPRTALPTVTVFESGWPDLRPGTGPDPKGPPDRAALFAPSRSQLKPLSYDDAPALARFVDYDVQRRDDLRARLSAPHPQTGEPVVDFVNTSAASLPLSLIDRAAAVGATGPDAVMALYLARERDWLLPHLPVDYVIPLALTALDLDEPLPLDLTTRLEPLDLKTQAARTPNWPGGISTVPDTVIGAATHALVLTGHHLSNPGPLGRLFSRDVQPLPLADADLVCQALRILTHLPVGYAQVLRRPDGWAHSWTHDLPEITQVAVLRRYPDAFDNYGWLRARDPIPRHALDRLPAVLAGLRTAGPRAGLAARRLSAAELRADPDDRTVDACIGIEALLGQGRDELTHRLSLRAATALSTRADDPAEAAAVYRLVKDVYSARSAIVHGRTTATHRQLKAPDGTRWPTDHLAVRVLRDLLQDHLARPEGWTPESLDALLLQRINVPVRPDVQSMTQ